jgi:adenylate cyclase
MENFKQKFADIMKLFDKDGIIKNYVKVVPYFKKYCFRTCLALGLAIPIGSLDAVIALSLKPYMDVVKNAGSVLMLPGSISNSDVWAADNVIRNNLFLIKYKNGYLPSIALKTFLLINNNPEIILTKNSLYFPKINKEIKHQKNKYFVTTPTKFYKTYDNGYSHIKYSALDVMNSYDAIQKGQKPILDPHIFDNKIVVIGANVKSGSGMNDNKHSSILSNHPGVDFQATAIDNILHNDFLKVLPQWFNTLLTFIGMLAVYGFIRVSNLYKSITSTFWIIFSYLVLSAICFYFNVVINVLTPIVMFIMTTILAYTHKFILESKSKEKVKSAMGKYMSQDVMKRVIQDIDNLGLGGKRANVSVLFSDIRGFTSMSEQMTPQQVSEILNEYFTEMEPIITQYNGIINKFIGDAVMAIFGEPIQDKNHASNAVKCAYAMLQKVKELQKKWAKEGKPKIEIGVGIATGEVFVGNIGSINRMEYTVIGDTVNLASRLEGYNKTYKTKLLISPATYEEVKGLVDVIKISDVQIRGKANKMDIYEVLRVL